VALLEFWCLHPYLKAQRLVADIEVKGHLESRPRMDRLEEFDIRVNTFNDDLPSWCIASLYNAACKRLDEVRGEYSMRSFVGSDIEGWPRLVTVVEGHERYIETGVAQGNDSDFFWCRLGHGRYEPGGMTEKAGWTIPKGTLRCQ